MRAEILRKSIGYKNGMDFYRNCEPSINYREALEAVRAAKKIDLSKDEAESPDYLSHLCQGYGIEIEFFTSCGGWKDENSWQEAGRVIYREWPENTSRIKRFDAQCLLAEFGFQSTGVLLAKLDQERWIVWENVADLDQVGLNPAYLRDGLPI